MNCKEFGSLSGGKWDRMYDQSRRVYKPVGLCPTLHTFGGGNTEVKVVIMSDKEKYRVRKLTPRECWRLMGFDDNDFEKAAKVCSNSQLYKQAGNSIVVNVLEQILVNLIPPDNRSQWLDELLRR